MGKNVVFEIDKKMNQWLRWWLTNSSVTEGHISAEGGVHIMLVKKEKEPEQKGCCCCRCGCGGK